MHFYACETLLTMFAVDFKTVTIITMSITATGIGRNALLTTCLSVCEEDNSKRCGRVFWDSVDKKKLW